MRQVASAVGSMVCLNVCTNEAYAEQLEPGLWAVGLGEPFGGDGLAAQAALSAWVRTFGVKRLILRTPMIVVLETCAAQGVDVLPAFADTFFGPVREGGILYRGRQRLGRMRYRRQLGAALQATAPRWASNHHLDASAELVRLGLPANRIVPHEGLAIIKPGVLGAARERPGGRDRLFALLCVGSQQQGKGQRDLLEAVKRLHGMGQKVSATLIGDGPDMSTLRTWIERNNTAAYVSLLGVRPHREVLQRMRDADAVVVPSQPVYPEGLPNVLYEALCVATPIIASRHPAWSTSLRADTDYASFAGGDAADLAKKIKALADDPARWSALSKNSEAAWGRLRCGMEIHELFTRWSRSSEEDEAILAAQALPNFSSNQ